MANVEAYQKSGDLLDDPRILEFATVQRAHARNLARQSAHPFGGVFILAAHNHVTINRALAEQHVRGRIVKGGYNRDSIRQQFCRLLGSRTLPHAESTSSSSPDACC